jgi:hypothetical protein
LPAFDGAVAEEEYVVPPVPLKVKLVPEMVADSLFTNPVIAALHVGSLPP